MRECAAYFEDRDCVFQEIGQQNDFGKDAYVDLPLDGGTEGHCVALQIKSGTSYRRHDGELFLPIDQHATTWRESTVPVFGVIFDPELRRLGWVDLTGYLRQYPQVMSGRVLVPANQILNETSFDSFCLAVGRYSQVPSQTLGLNLLSDDPARQAEALVDAWALSRRDARYLLLCRRVILELPQESTRRLIWRLSHVAGNPDILHTAETWLPAPIQARLRESFRWSSAEIVHALLSIDPHEEWGRGTLGQCLDMLFAADEGFLDQVPAATKTLLALGEIEAAERLTAVALGHTDDPQSLLNAQFDRFSALSKSRWLLDLRTFLREGNEFSPYL
ncbi:hypothetical protein ABIE09_004493 [Lysobacter enzymogenes]|uniref:DUF4365 domain-containing protein n=1 Tax=Lysobacter enzymogenes TaxID=69 RepID=UPI003390CFCD